MNSKQSTPPPPRRKRGLTIGLITATLFAIGITYFYFCENQLDSLNNKPFIKAPLNLELSENFPKDFMGRLTIHSNEIPEIIDELTSYILSDDLKDSDKKDIFVLTFNQVNKTIDFNPFSSKNKNGNPTLNNTIRPCHSTTCRNASCLRDTLENIIGDGDRDVTITYKRNSLSVTISWSYEGESC